MFYNLGLVFGLPEKTPKFVNHFYSYEKIASKLINIGGKQGEWTGQATGKKSAEYSL